MVYASIADEDILLTTLVLDEIRQRAEDDHRSQGRLDGVTHRSLRLELAGKDWQMVQKKQWVWAPRPARPALPDKVEKQTIITACETFIGEVLKPRFLPAIRPTSWNYVVDIRGAWAGGRYRFMQRYRSGMEHNLGEEFDAPFSRIDRMGPDRFDIYWMRHTGQWWRLHVGVSLAEALRILETDEVLHPV